MNTTPDATLPPPPACYQAFEDALAYAKLYGKQYVTRSEAGLYWATGHLMPRDMIVWDADKPSGSH